MAKLWIPGGDLPSLPRAPKAPAVFETTPYRNRGMPAAPPFSPELENLVIATCVDVGMPRWAAEQIRENPYRRFEAALVYDDVQSAAEGDKEAKERVDYYRFAFEQARREQVIADKPSDTIGLPD